jgi:hypothetical protein
LSLLIDVTGLLRRADIPHAVIGAAALPDLPDECAALWRRILEQREAST